MLTARPVTSNLQQPLIDEEKEVLDSQQQREAQRKQIKEERRANRDKYIQVMRGLVEEFNQYFEQYSETEFKDEEVRLDEYDQSILSGLEQLVKNYQHGLDDKRLNNLSDNEVFYEKECLLSIKRIINGEDKNKFIKELETNIRFLKKAHAMHPIPDYQSRDCISPAMGRFLKKMGIALIPITGSAAAAYGIFRGLMSNCNDSPCDMTGSIAGATVLGLLCLVLTGGLTADCARNQSCFDDHGEQRDWEGIGKSNKELYQRKTMNQSLLSDFSFIAKKSKTVKKTQQPPTGVYVVQLGESGGTDIVSAPPSYLGSRP